MSWVSGPRAPLEIALRCATGEAHCPLYFAQCCQHTAWKEGVQGALVPSHVLPACQPPPRTAPPCPCSLLSLIYGQTDGASQPHWDKLTPLVLVSRMIPDPMHNPNATGTCTHTHTHNLGPLTLEIRWEPLQPRPALPHPAVAVGSHAAPRAHSHLQHFLLHASWTASSESTLATSSAATSRWCFPAII